MSEVTPVVSAQHGALFLAEQSDTEPGIELRPYAGYGFPPAGRPGRRVPSRRGPRRPGRDGGQADPHHRRPAGLHHGRLRPRRRQPLDAPGHADHVRGAGPRRPRARRAAPFTEVNEAFLDQLAETLGIVINTIRANMRTEELLVQSQALTSELQKQSEELRQTNDELQDKAVLLSEQNRDIEIKNARSSWREPAWRTRPRSSRSPRSTSRSSWRT
jgi:hypothetical protein